MPPLPPHPPPFRYQDLPPSVRDWLPGVAEQVRSLAYRTACDLIRVGRLLADARSRVKRRTFGRWVEAELPWSRSHAYRLIAVADAFGPLVGPGAGERIDPTALYLLARPEVPPAARAYAAELAADRPVTPADAREIIDAHRRGGREPTRAEVDEHDRRMKPVRDAEADARKAAGRPVDPAALAAAWAAFAELVAASTVVHVGVIAEEGGEDEALYSVTAHAEGDRPRNAVRRDLAAAVLAVLGREPERWCAGCGRSHPVGQFGANNRVPDGLNRYCKAFERERLKEWKQKRRGGRPGGPPAA